MNSDADRETSGFTPSRVLLVEDNVIVALNAEELLREIGATEVIVANSVAEAQSCCDKYDFDFALLDLNLGNETSIGIANRLRAAKVPFVFASGYDDYGLLPPDLGDSPILRKPYMLTDLERTVRSVFAPQ
jgi:two-component SAPR family response regulator